MLYQLTDKKILVLNLKKTYDIVPSNKLWIALKTIGMNKYWIQEKYIEIISCVKQEPYISYGYGRKDLCRLEKTYKLVHIFHQLENKIYD